VRARVDAVVRDPATARTLKAWYYQMCKRPCFHDEYLQAFNRPNTHLVDTDGKGVERITEGGVVVGGREYPVDCIVYASGFEAGTFYTRRTGYEITGRGGVTLSSYWADGIRTLHGLQVHGFPNAFVVQFSQGAMTIFNFAHNIMEAARTITACIKHTLDEGFAEVEVSRQAEEAWQRLLLSGGNISPQNCTPGYYNNEGKEPGPYERSRADYPGGAGAFFGYIKEWRASGSFAGLEFRRPT
jgi:cation diffusion facilitator CzcD-associated flavoprotein CzcO